MVSPMNARVGSSVVVVVALILGGTASAQPGGQPPPPPPPGGPYYAPAPMMPPPPPPPGRRGFLIGFGLGGGEIASTDCDGCESLAGFAFDFSVGGMLNPNLAIMYDAFGVIRVEEGAALTNSVNTLAAQYWVTPIVWLKGGIGVSQIRLSDSEGTIAAEYGFGATAGVGVELIRSDTFALDASARLSHGTFDGGGLSNLAVLVGFHWY
jgi:hypothetical protein